ncbi:BTAD domain-containing putative transcriptional regulator [Amycolatopsis sp. A133]|uniref:AfsR/SARP family transcriptional regulator n=1 Tax=Amycolatopsis sp. A133 TaxID=3064472 RepID=UPI0027EA8E4D|nr:BTAD domain-containing putative transcriptional regulator [Amycolatopsis sp. A133]MDQ7803629.1 BTAD domain-containing putative transcriptional regulator [Amycolatopsis sp. A133]
MYFQLLGTVRVQRDGERVDLGGLRQQRLLVMLLLDAGKVVSADRLLEAMWDGAPPVTARRQLHNAVAALRRSFGAAKHIVVKDGPGYRITVTAQDVDAHRFATMVAAASAAASVGRTEAAVELLEAALALWEGPALSGLSSPAFEIAAARFEENRVTATERLAVLRLDGGDAAAVVVQLGELVSRHPLREETRKLLMLALHRCGRTADALTVYEQGRRLLRDELGVDPGAGLRELYERILRDELPHRKAAEPGGRSFLPYDTAHFTGRAEELEFLTGSRPAGTALSILAIDGMAGVGKTTLAVRLAHQLAHGFPEGHLFIDLHGHTAGQEPLDPGTALERLLLDFGLAPEQVPGDTGQRAARWRAEVAERRVLVVLDNALDAGQVRPLLPGTGKAQVIITSRRRLAGLDGVTSRSLDVFPAGDAAALFTRVAGAGRTAQRPDAVAEVVALCGHLPLAVGIAAWRFHNRPAWSLEDLVFRLRDRAGRLAELRMGDRSVAAQFEVSYRKLSPGQRRLFRILGGTTRPGEEFDAGTAARLVNQPVREAERLLEELFDAHMLRQRATGCYHFHELVHEHARAKTEEPDDGLLTTFGRTLPSVTKVEYSLG